MKKVFNSCLGAVLLSNLFMMRLQKGSVDCISFIEVSLGYPYSCCLSCPYYTLSLGCYPCLSLSPVVVVFRFP